MLRRPKHSKLEVVAPEEEEEERLTTEAPRGGHKYAQNFGEEILKGRKLLKNFCAYGKEMVKQILQNKMRVD